uniref:Uncharacterized protein n=1 Tax=Oryza meridionalis TaxID=40149 RepID=A0A0E0F191_9ORYZ
SHFSLSLPPHRIPISSRSRTVAALKSDFFLSLVLAATPIHAATTTDPRRRATSAPPPPLSRASSVQPRRHLHRSASHNVILQANNCLGTTNILSLWLGGNFTIAYRLP